MSVREWSCCHHIPQILYSDDYLAFMQKKLEMCNFEFAKHNGKRGRIIFDDLMYSGSVLFSKAKQCHGLDEYEVCHVSHKT